MTKTTETTIEADPKLPIIRMTRDFAATPQQLFRAHTDPVLFAQWVGPNAMDTRIKHWDARTGGSWRFVQVEEGAEYAFPGCFHEVRRTVSCRPLPSRVSPTASPWRRCGSTTSATAAPGCARSGWSTASKAETPGWQVAWRPGSIRDTPSSTGCLPMALSDRPAERHRQVGQLFTNRVRGTRRWNAPSPVAGWVARDIVRHLTQWLPGFLSAGAAIELPSGPSSLVDLGAARTADRAAALDYRASALRADQVLAAHLDSLPKAGPGAHLA